MITRKLPVDAALIPVTTPSQPLCVQCKHAHLYRSASPQLSVCRPRAASHAHRRQPCVTDTSGLNSRDTGGEGAALQGTSVHGAGRRTASHDVHQRSDTQRSTHLRRQYDNDNGIRAHRSFFPRTAVADEERTRPAGDFTRGMGSVLRASFSALTPSAG